jgi:hypothetical protein
MIENYRSGILWSNFMSNSEIAPALSAIGFVDDIVATDDPQIDKMDWSVYPTSSDGNLNIKLNEKPFTNLTIKIADNLGRNIPFHQSLSPIGDDLFALTVDANFSGWVWVAITDGFHFSATKPVWIN